MENDMIDVPVSEIREPLRELCTYIPYFEERVGGTFKFQYWDEETGELKDYEGHEESNRQASFPDPVWDETWQKFKRKTLSLLMWFCPASSASQITPWQSSPPGSLGCLAAARGRLAKAKSRRSRDEDWWRWR